MFPFKATLQTGNKTPGKNTKEFVVVHHTGTGEGTIRGVLDQLTNVLSCHFVIDTDGSAYKIGSPDDILWHAGVSSWKGRTDMNRYALGIEIIGPLADGGFTDAQRKTAKDLIQHLMAVFAIPSQNIIRHKDVAPNRKWDVSDTFWDGQYPDFASYQASLSPCEYADYGQLAAQAGIWNGQDPERPPTRSEAVAIFQHTYSGQVPWDGSRPNDPITTFEINTLSLRTFGIGCDASTRRELAAFCYRLSRPR